MKTLAKSHVCNHFVIGEKKKFKIYLPGLASYRDFRETGPRPANDPQTGNDLQIEPQMTLGGEMIPDRLTISI